MAFPVWLVLPALVVVLLPALLAELRDAVQVEKVCLVQVAAQALAFAEQVAVLVWFPVVAW